MACFMLARALTLDVTFDGAGENASLRIRTIGG